MGKHTKANLLKHAQKEHKKYTKAYFAKKFHASFGPPLEFQVWAAAQGLMI